MRKAFEEQRRFGCQTIGDIALNVNCRDEIIPILAALQHISLDRAHRTPCYVKRRIVI